MKRQALPTEIDPVFYEKKHIQHRGKARSAPWKDSLSTEERLAQHRGKIRSAPWKGLLSTGESLIWFQGAKL